MPSYLVFAHMAVGGIILLMGKRLFWFFVMVAGFFLGMEVVGDLLIGYPGWVVWVSAAFAGLAGALLAVFFQRVAFVIAGLYGGGYLAIVLVHSFGWPLSDTAVFIAGGIIGTIFAAVAMDWAIIVLSSLAGSSIVVAALGLQPMQGLLAGVGLTGAGIIVQATQLRRVPGKPTSKTGYD